MPELLTVSQAMSAAKIGRTKLYQEICSGRLRAIKIGKLTRIRRTDFDA